jgi:NADPH:quinone reductase-like Zn-dependent oxidoreductase
MRALRFDRFGPPGQLQVQEIERPHSQGEEVVVQVHAAGVNPSDVKNVAGVMEGTTLPRTPGRDFAGVVADGPAELLRTEVWGTGGDIGFTRDGSHAEYLLLPSEAVRQKPRSLSLIEAGSIGLTYITAWLAIVDAAQLQAGETLLVIGATGGVGSAAIQIGRWQGSRVIGTVRREADRNVAHHNGADIVIDLSSGALADQIRDATGGKGANVILDTVGGPMFEPCLLSLARKGRQAEISSPAKDRRVSFDLIDFYHRESRLLGVDSRKLGVVDCGLILARLTPGFEQGALRPPASGIKLYPLSDGVAAYEAVAQGSGRVALVMR